MNLNKNSNLHNFRAHNYSWDSIRLVLLFRAGLFEYFLYFCE